MKKARKKKTEAVPASAESMIIPVLGRNVTVKVVPQSEVDPEDNETQGSWHVRSFEIALDKELTESARMRILLHELMHAVLDLSGIAAVEGFKPFEEAVCTAAENLAPALEVMISKAKQMG